MFNEYELNHTERAIIEEFTRNSGIPVFTDAFRFAYIFGPVAYSAAGCYQHASGPYPETIWYTPGNDPKKSIDAFFHEMAHATGPRVGRKIICLQECQKLGSMLLYALEEVIAETTAKKLATHFGLLTPHMETECERYISYWSKYGKGLQPADLHQVEEKSNEAMEYILKNWLPDFNSTRSAA